MSLDLKMVSSRDYLTTGEELSVKYASVHALLLAFYLCQVDHIGVQPKLYLYTKYRGVLLYLKERLLAQEVYIGA
jgi:hypothetical protein